MDDINLILREVETQSKCSGDYVVQYSDHWIENNNCLYIQMELCSDNLLNFIQQRPQFFGRKDTDPMEPLEYFMSCQLFREVLECVQYLHDQKIMHRDLNPRNILFCQKGKNDRFLKLCDFGLAKIVGSTSRTHTMGLGTPCYMAREVILGKRYSAKCDIFSVGMIAMQIFNSFE